MELLEIIDMESIEIKKVLISKKFILNFLMM